MPISYLNFIYFEVTVVNIMDICENLRLLYRIRHCSRCQGNTEFFCKECKSELCSMCKEKHCIDLDSKDHEVVVYRNKSISSSEQVACERYTAYGYKMFCKPCEIPLCVHFRHAQHETTDIFTAFELKRKLHKKTINSIRSDALYYSHLLLANTRTDLKSRQSTNLCSQIHSRLKTKALKVKDELETAVCNDKSRHRCSIQKKTMLSHLARIEEYEDLFEQSAKKPLRFLSFVKKTGIVQGEGNILLKQHGMLSLIDRLNYVAVNQLVGAMIEKRKRSIENEHSVKVMSTVLRKTSFKFKAFPPIIPRRPCQESDQIWFSDRNYLSLINTNGEEMHLLNDLSFRFYPRATYTITREQELIYLDKNNKFVKISRDMKATYLPFVTDDIFRPNCIFCSPYSGDLLIGMLNNSTNACKIAKYNTKEDPRSPKHPEIICYIENWDPSFLTDNINGDIIVVDYFLRSLKGMDRTGQHRFFFTKKPIGYPVWPLGICTDTLSHILVTFGPTIIMLNKEGQFISCLLTQSNHISPIILKFDYEKHLLWIRVESCTFSAYRYIERQDVLTGILCFFSDKLK